MEFSFHVGIFPVIFLFPRSDFTALVFKRNFSSRDSNQNPFGWESSTPTIKGTQFYPVLFSHLLYLLAFYVLVLLSFLLCPCPLICPTSTLSSPPARPPAVTGSLLWLCPFLLLCPNPLRSAVILKVHKNENFLGFDFEIVLFRR